MQIRTLTENDAEEFWEVRLEGLRLHPEAFGSSYEESKEVPIDQVRERMSTRTTAGDNFIVGAFDGRLVGVVGFAREEQRKTRHRGMIWGVYVRPEARSKGVGRRLIEEAIARASEIDGLEQLHLGVAVVNAPARALYCSVGFEDYGIEPHSLKVDGAYYDEAMMILRLR